MKITIDRAGRIVVPKPLRDRLGMTPGTELVVEADGEGIVIRPARTGGELVRRDGVLVHRGAGGPTPGIDVVEMIRRGREGRLRLPPGDR